MAAREQAVLEVSVTGVDKAASQFSNFQQTTTRTMSASEAAVTRSLKNMVAQFVGVAAVARSVQNVVSSGIGFDRFVEDTTTSFTVMMKSAEKAKAQMKDLYDFAVNSPLTFKETAASSKQLMAYGFAAEELIPTMKTLGTVAIATGHSLDDISYVYGTLKSQGRAYSRDLMQFGMRGIPIYEELAKVMNVNVNQIQKMASEGKIGFTEVEKAFQNMTTGSGRFAGTIEGYMTTLTGKLSMLSDIAQQSSGTLMSGVTDQLKNLVESLTKTFQSSGFQDFISEMSSGLGVIASILGTILSLFVQLLPILSKLLVIWLAFAAVQFWFKLPSLLMGAAQGLAAMSAATMTATSATVGLGFAWDKVATTIAASSTAISSLLIPIAVVAAAIAAITYGMEEAQKKAKMMKDKAYFEQEIVKKGAETFSQLKSSGISVDQTIQVSYVKKLAADYGKTNAEVAKLFYFNQLISAESAKIAGFNVDAWVAEQKNAQWAEKTAKELSKRSFISTLEAVGLNISEWDTEVDTVVTSLNKMGKVAGKEWSKFTEPSATWMETMITKDLPSTDILSEMLKVGVSRSTVDDETKKIYTQKVKILTEDLTNLINDDIAKGTDHIELKKWLAQQLNEAQAMLDGLGKKAKKTQQEMLPVLATWWTPMVQSAKATLDPIDDINIATLQSLESVDKEYANQIAILDKQANILAAEGGNEIELNQIAVQRIELFNTLLGLHKDITAEGKKQKNLKLYETATEGNSAVMDQWKANAGAAYARGGGTGTATGAAIQGTSQMLSGTQMGAMATGGNPVAVAMTALVDFAKSIENVNAILNPFTTIFEAMRTTLEPIVNNVLQPIVDILQMVGEAIAPVISVLVASLKPAIVQIYLVTAPLIAAMQMLAAAHIWFYNTIIVTVANWIIDIVNAIIKVLNKIPGVHIRYIDQLEKMNTAVADLTDTINNQKSALDKTIDYLTNKINKAIDDQLSSLQDLYEVGAISATSYDAQANALNAQKINTDNIMVSSADMALTGKDIYERLYALYDLKDAIDNGNLTNAQIASLLQQYQISSSTEESRIKNAVLAALVAYNTASGTTSTVSSNASTAVLANLKVAQAQMQFAFSMMNAFSAMGDVGGFLIWASMASAVTSQLQAIVESVTNMGLNPNSFAVGTANVPSDQLAQVHKGEGIIPATFMDSIRSGELALASGKNEGSGQSVIVNVTVQGSVQTENDLATSIAQAIYVQRSRGALTV